MKNLYNSILVLLLCVSTLLSCEKSPFEEETSGLKEVRIAVVLPEKDRESIWNNALELAAENIKKAYINFISVITL